MDIQATMIGRLTADVDLDYTPNGNAVGHFNLAVNRTMKNKQGVREADFPYFEIWKKPAIYLAEHTKKGCRIAVQAVYRTESYTKDNQRFYKNYWIVQSFEVLENITTENSIPQQEQQNQYQQAFNRVSNQNAQDQQFQQQPIDGMSQYGANTYNER